jgi:hypothetical protein
MKKMTVAVGMIILSTAGCGFNANTSTTAAPSVTPTSTQSENNAGEQQKVSPKATINSLKALDLKLQNRSLANKVLIQRSQKIKNGLVEGQVVSAKSLAKRIKQGDAACVLVSAESQLPKNGQTLSSIKVSEKSVGKKGSKDLLHLRVFLSWKDQFFLLDCEKMGSITAADLRSTLKGTFQVSERP